MREALEGRMRNSQLLDQTRDLRVYQETSGLSPQRLYLVNNIRKAKAHMKVLLVDVNNLTKRVSESSLSCAYVSRRSEFSQLRPEEKTLLLIKLLQLVQNAALAHEDVDDALARRLPVGAELHVLVKQPLIKAVKLLLAEEMERFGGEVGTERGEGGEVGLRGRVREDHALSDFIAL